MLHGRFLTMGRTRSLLAGMTLTTMLLCYTAVVSAQETHCWTTSGSTGTVDTADVQSVTLTENTAEINQKIGTATGEIRYNVVAVEGLFVQFKYMQARFADNGPNARVFLHLKTLNMKSGAITLLGALDSNEFGPAPQAQFQTKRLPDFNFDFANNIYYIEAQLIKSQDNPKEPAGAPLIRAIQICGV
jgi:hypothetical protein